MILPNIMDFEASGFGAESYPIEVGVCLADQQRFCALIKPPAEWQHWDVSAESVHGVSRETLMKVGQSPADVCDELNRQLQGLTLYSDAWVLDKTWLNKLYDTAGMWPTFNLSAIENIQTEGQHFLWDQVRTQMLTEQHFTRHRASADAQFIQQVFARSHLLDDMKASRKQVAR